MTSMDTTSRSLEDQAKMKSFTLLKGYIEDGWSNARITRLSSEQFELFSKITMQEAMDSGYCMDGMDQTDFKCDSGA